MQQLHKDPNFKQKKKSKFAPTPEDVMAELDCPPYQDSMSLGSGFWDWVWEEIARERLRQREDSLYEIRRREREAARQARQEAREKRREERRRKREEERLRKRQQPQRDTL
jgi:hypothetical protein